MSVFNNNLLLGAGGQGDAAFDPTLITNSVWLDGSADFLSAELGAKTRTKAVIGTWFQRTNITVAQTTIFSKKGTGSVSRFALAHTGSVLTIFDFDGSSFQYEATGTMALRDVGWYHIMISIDTTASAGSRLKLFINGIDQTSTLSVSPDYTENDNPSITGASGGPTQWGMGPNGSTQLWNGYLAQSFMLDDDSIQNSDVAVTDILDSFTYGTNGSQFVPKANAGIATLASSAGGDSFCLDFANSSDLGNDISSNNNDFSLTSMAAANQSTHTPSLTYLQFNPLQKFGTAALSEGNTRVGVDVYDAIRGTKFITSGKHYLELTINTVNNSYLGVANGSSNPSSFASSNVACLQKSGDIYINDSIPSGQSARSKAVATGDVIGILIDADAKKFWQSVNGTINSLDRNNSITVSDSDVLAGTGGFDLSGLTGDDGNYTIHIGNSDGTSADVSVNSGHKDFSHTPPTGYLDWGSNNYTAPEFQGADYFNTNLYTGNGTAIGSGGKAVTGAGFKPDWTWIKNRDAVDSHSLYDLVRGTTKQIESDNGAVQTTEAEGLTTFGTDGFTVGNLAQVNTNTEDYVSWNWLGNNATESISASGANPTLASTNTASDSGAFGMCTYTGNATAGSTVKHSLGGVPDMIMFKRFGATTANWVVYNKVLGAGNSDYLMLDLALAEGGAGAIAWLNSTAATSTLVTLGDDGNVNASDTYIMYLFRNVPGVCRVGSYTGNASNPGGPYISCGFTPRWIMFKSTGTNSWTIFDTARDPINGPGKEFLHPDLTSAGSRSSGSLLGVDFLADGFRVLTTGGNGSSSGVQYIYLAMADIGGNGTLPPIYGR